MAGKGTAVITIMGRDLVMKALDSLAERLSADTPSPTAVQQIANSWKAMSATDRDEIARHIAVGVEAAVVAIPLALAAAKARKKDKKKGGKKKKKGKKK